MFTTIFFVQFFIFAQLQYTYNVDKLATEQQVIDSINYNKYISSYLNTTTNGIVRDQNGNSISGLSIYSSTIYYEALLSAGRNFDNTTADSVYIEPNPKNGSNVTQNPASSGNDSESWVFKLSTQDSTGSITGIDKKITDITATSAEIKYCGSSLNPFSEGFWYTYTNKNGDTFKEVPYFSASGNGMTGVIDALTGPGGNYSATISYKEDKANYTHGSLQDGSTNGGNIRISFNLTSDKEYTEADGSIKAANSSIGEFTLNVTVRTDDTVDTIRERLGKISVFDMASTTSRTYSSYTRVNTSAAKVSESEETPVYEYIKRKNLDIQAGANEGDIIDISYDVLDNDFLGITETNTLTAENSAKAITEVSNALKIVSSQRSYFGAMQNRLIDARAVDLCSSENTQASESIIRDTDMAKEMVQLAMSNILSQVGESMMAQANKSGENILQLLT